MCAGGEARDASQSEIYPLTTRLLGDEARYGDREPVSMQIYAPPTYTHPRLLTLAHATSEHPRKPELTTRGSPAARLPAGGPHFDPQTHPHPDRNAHHPTFHDPYGCIEADGMMGTMKDSQGDVATFLKLIGGVHLYAAASRSHVASTNDWGA